MESDGKVAEGEKSERCDENCTDVRRWRTGDRVADCDVLQVRDEMMEERMRWDERWIPDVEEQPLQLNVDDDFKDGAERS